VAQRYSAEIRYPGNSAFRYGFLSAFDVFGILPKPKIVRVLPLRNNEGLEDDSKRIGEYLSAAIDKAKPKD
jgi:hypothetical protein